MPAKRKKPAEETGNNSSILDMTLTLMENTVEESPWPRETDLLIFSNTLNKVISRKKRSTDRIKALEGNIERQSTNYQIEIETYRKTKEAELASFLEQSEKLKEQLVELRETNHYLEEKEGREDNTGDLRTDLKQKKAQYNEVDANLSSLVSLAETLQELKERELKKYEVTLGVLEKADNKINQENTNIDNLNNMLSNYETEIKSNEEKIETLKANVKNFNNNIEPHQEERERIRALVNQVKSEFDRKKEEINSQLKEAIKEQGHKEHIKLKDVHQKKLEKAINDFKLANAEFVKFKTQLSEYEMETKKLENALEKKKEEKEEAVVRYKHMKERYDKNEYSKMNEDLIKLKQIEEIIARKNEEREVELGNLANNTTRYKIYLSDLIRTLKEEEMEEI
eukprot:GAHX01000752.1.p1 GENE.GAHX01000752.1~~GAHX01000752.1.p1  ORF type:complete len:397 (+),score=122.72 GAHX01000752.1:23-1213(+)